MNMIMMIHVALNNNDIRVTNVFNTMYIYNFGTGDLHSKTLFNKYNRTFFQIDGCKTYA